MKKIIITLMALFLFSTFLQAQELTQKEISGIDAYINKKISFDRKRVESTILPKVFEAVFYDVKINYHFTDGKSFKTIMLVKGKSGIVEIEECSSTGGMPALQSIIKKDFKIKSDADSLLFEEALDVLYPLGGFDKKKKERYKIGNDWYFIRGTFFSNKKGFIVSVNEKGNITKIKYDLGIKRSKEKK